MNLTPLKYILLIENGLTVFRNYLCLKKCTRIFVHCWVTFTIFNLTANAVINFKIPTVINYVQQIYNISSISFSFYVMLAPLFYSKKFYNLLLNFDAFYKIFDDGVYNQRMIKAQKVLTFIILLICGIEIFIFTYVRVYYSDTHNTGFVISSLSQFNYSVSDFRFIYQHFVMGSIFFVLSEQLKAITRSIDDEISAISENRGNMEHVENSPRVAVNHDKLNKWVQAYDNINDTSILCDSMFSVQLTIMLLIVTSYYIIMLYTIATITVQGVQLLSSLLMNLFSMMVFLMALFVVSSSGQMIQNSSIELQQKLCEFCVHALENEEYYKLAKDLLRCVRTRPIRMHVFGTLDVNMAMLPSIVAFFTSYTVIVLQFNNVL